MILMAIEATRIKMLANERVTGRVMVEFDIQPACRRMAVATFCAHRVVMNIIGLVAVVAPCLGIAKLRLGLVTSFTRGFGVPADQLEIRIRVIEYRPVELNDVCITALMVGMTVSACVEAGIVEEAMESHHVADVECDVLVTVQAQRTLFFAIKCLMAGTTIGLIFGVPLDNIARHDQGFNLSECMCGYKG